MGALLTVARTVWGEARGEGWPGQVAVAAVIRNRVRRPGWWGADYEAVCRKPRQFSCWDDTPEVASRAPAQMIMPYAAAAYVIHGEAEDPTGGATNYHTIKPPPWAATWPPEWARRMTETARIGGHVFYRER